MEATKRCVDCALEIRPEAKRCPYCRTRQPGAEPLHRGVEGRTLAGVCAALAARLRVDVALVRVAFVLGLVVSAGLALTLYLLLWAFTPPAALGTPPVQRFVDWLTRLLRAPGPGVPTSPGGEPRL